jgi:hypothetical protein
MTRILAALLAILLSATFATAQSFGGGVAPSNIYAINDNVSDQAGGGSIPGFQNIAGYTPVSGTITGSTFVLVAIGQSIGTNRAPTPYTPVNALVQNLNPYDGLIYTAKDPLLGPNNTGGNYNTRLADKLITDGKFPRVIIVPVPIGGTSVLDWTPAGVMNQRLRAACLWIRSYGWIGNANVKFGVIYDQGQADVTLGTGSALWQSRYAQVKASFVALGCYFDWFVPIDTMITNVTDPTIQAAQAAVVGGRTFAAWNTDSLTGGTNRQADGIHLSDVGSASNAALAATIIEAHY